MVTPQAPRMFIGVCHCEAVGFEYRTLIRPDQWSLRACQCSFCRAHGVLTTSDPSGAVTFFEYGAGAMRRYRFAQRTADFLLCSNCGVYLGAVIDTARGRFGIINVNALTNRPVDATAAAAHYEGESVDQRVRRREQRWTPVVGSI